MISLDDRNYRRECTSILGRATRFVLCRFNLTVDERKLLSSFAIDARHRNSNFTPGNYSYEGTRQ